MNRMQSRNQSSFLFLMVLPAFALLSCKGKINPAPAKNPPVLVDVILANPQKIINTVEANGTTIANEFVELHPEVSGRVIFLDIPEGSFVTKGTMLARINDEDLEAQLNKSRVALDLAQKTVSRYKQLLAVNGINQSDYDAALNTLQNDQADIRYEQALIDKTLIRAPFDGVLGLRQISPGAYVTPSDIIASLQQINRVKIDFTLPVEYSNLVKMGNVVDIEANDGKNFYGKARILAVEPQANTATRNLMVRALLLKGTLPTGSFVKVEIGNAGTHAIMIPTNSVIPDDKNNQVVLVRNGLAKFVNVMTGIRQADNVEITQGIQPGDTVVVSGVLFARPDHPVTIRSIKTLQEIDSTVN